MWEVRVFTGSDARGRPTLLSRTVHGGKRDAQLDAWVEPKLDTWAPSSAREQQSRVNIIEKDPIARSPLARLAIGDVERWHTRLRKAERQDAGIKNQHGVLRAALAQAVRWGWASTNVAALARLKSSRTQQRGAVECVMCGLWGTRTDRLVVAVMPGNAGGAKGPDLGL